MPREYILGALTVATEESRFARPEKTNEIGISRRNVDNRLSCSEISVGEADALHSNSIKSLLQSDQELRKQLYEGPTILFGHSGGIFINS